MQAKGAALTSWLLFVGVADGTPCEYGGLPLTEGGLRYHIHPVTGHLLTTHVQPVTQDSGALVHKPLREDKSIVKVSHTPEMQSDPDKKEWMHVKE